MAAQEAVTKLGDWWSVGMIVAQAARGHHPLTLPQGMSPTAPAILDEMAQLGVPNLDRIYDDRVRLLCQGSLTRDPSQRWGAEQIRCGSAGWPSGSRKPRSGAQAILTKMLGWSRHVNVLGPRSSTPRFR